MTNRDADRQYELHHHRETMAFDRYIERVLNYRGNDTYLVANNPLMQTEAAAPLWTELQPDQRFIQPGAHGGTHLWVGPEGTVTNLHYDIGNVLFVQVYGHKRWTLIPPDNSERLYVDPPGTVYSAVDIVDPDLRRFPAFGEVQRCDFVISPGEALLVPRHWWHAVQGIDVSISLSFTTFLFGNPFFDKGGGA